MQAKDINELLRKTEHYDKDERYMATSDIIAILKREGRGGIDGHLESRICSAVLKQVSWHSYARHFSFFFSFIPFAMLFSLACSCDEKHVSLSLAFGSWYI